MFAKCNRFQRVGSALAILASCVALCGISSKNGEDSHPVDPPSYLPWYTAVPSPLSSAYVSIGGAWGAANFYNTHETPDEVPGTGILNSGQCLFICYGAPGVPSHHYLDYGNDVNPGSPGTSDTHHGAPNDCSPCAAGIRNNAFSVTVEVNPPPTGGPYFLSLDGGGNFAFLGSLYSGAAVVAGAGTGTAEPSPTPGSLVSHTGAGKGDVLLGSGSDYAKCDYGETSTGTLTCSKPLLVAVGSTSAGLSASGVVWAMGGVQPNSASAGGSGGYAPEAFSIGLATPHPQILSGSCTVTGSGTCTFPNSFGFADTTYNCGVSAQGATPTAASYVRTSASSITIYTSTLVSSVTFSYICMR